MKTVQRLWHDEAGFVVSMELVLVATILVIGLIVGLNAVRNSTVNELADVAAAVDNLNQSVGVKGLEGHAADVAGWKFADNPDFCDDGTDGGSGSTAACIEQDEAPVPEDGTNGYDPSGP